MPQSYATAADLAGLTVGPEPTVEQQQALLDAAWVRLRTKPGVAALVSAGTLDTEVVRLVLVEMVQAVIRNPTGQRSGSETAGPFARSWSWDLATATGQLRVTAEHLEMLGVTPATSYTVSTVFEPAWES